MTTIDAVDAIASLSLLNVHHAATYGEALKLFNGSVTNPEEKEELKKLIAYFYPKIIENAKRVLEFAKV